MSPIILALGAFVLFAALLIGMYFAQQGANRFGAWKRANPIAAALLVASVFALIIGIWATANQDLIDCWPQHKAACLFPTQHVR